jgi:hypothetical protein
MNETVLAEAERRIREIPEIRADTISRSLADLREISPANEWLVTDWLTSGTIPAFEYKGLSVTALVDALKTHPLFAIIMLDKLMKDEHAFSLIIGQRDGQFVFTSRDAILDPPPEPAADGLTRTLAETAAGYLRRHEIDPPELSTGGDLRSPLWTAVIEAARVTTREDLEETVDGLREIIELAESAEGAGDDEGALTEVGRVALVLRAIERLAADDLRRQQPGTDEPGTDEPGTDKH